jgi:hypothetical protein
LVIIKKNKKKMNFFRKFLFETKEDKNSKLSEYLISLFKNQDFTLFEKEIKKIPEKDENQKISLLNKLLLENTNLLEINLDLQKIKFLINMKAEINKRYKKIKNNLNF